VTDDYERTYLEIWGEPPPKPGPEPARPEALGQTPGPAPAPALNGSGHQPAPAGEVSDPSTDLDRKANEVIQRMLVETLRRIEDRLAVMEERDRTAKSSPDAAGTPGEQLTKMSEEVGRFLENTRRVNEQLAGLQLESASRLELLAQKVKEIQARPLHWPPH
jgi:hypothetical protein